MGYIVTPNRTDDENAPKWLLRDFAEHLSAARAYDTIVARGIKFNKSTDIDEIGFGHGIVAFCGEAKGYAKKNAPHKKKFENKRIHFNPEKGQMYTSWDHPALDAITAHFGYNGLTYIDTGNRYAKK